MKKHLYAYGYKLLFSSLKEENNFKTIHIDKIDKFPSNNFKKIINFHTNQNRTIYLKVINDFKTEKSFEKWLFVVDGVISFLCDTKTNQVYYQKDYDYTDERRDYWLIHIVLPMFFTLKKSYYLLHTGAVNINNKAVLFTGNSHAGKSTLTDYFLKKKHKLLSDDKLATFKKDDIFYCVPSHPYHRPYRGVEDLGIKTDNFDTKQLPIDKIYWIKPVKENDNILINELIGIKNFEVLRYSTEMDLSVDLDRFKYITDLANTIQVYEIQIPRNMDRLEEVYNSIIIHTKKND